MRQILVLVPAALVATACGGRGAPEPAAEPMPAVAAAPNAPRAARPWSPADPPPRQAAPAPPTAPTPPLFTRLGGLDAIRSVVDTFHTRIMSDDRINAFFRGVDDAVLRRLLTEQICQATGGPCVYSGRSMPEAHRGMNLTDAHFNALVEDLVYALDAHRVPAAEKNELLTALGGLRGQIVGQ
jgi:hemoglobin